MNSLRARTPDLLRPLSVGDLIDEAIWLYRKNLPRFILIAALLRVPLLAVSIVFADIERLPERVPLLTLALDHVVVQSMMSAIMTSAVAALVDGKVFVVWDAIRQLLPRLPYLLINYLTVFATLGVMGFGAALALLSMVVLGDQLQVFDWFYPLGELLTLAVFLLLVLVVAALPALVLAARWALSLQVIVLERRHPLAAIRRSAALVRGQQRHVMLALAALTILMFILSTGPAALAQFIGESLSPGYERGYGLDLITLLFGYVAPALIQILCSPIAFIARALLYYDLRVRAEGYDLQVRLARWQEQAA